nr:MAG TPA: hypothetical protein [Siphoviridae sp. ctngg6]
MKIISWFDWFVKRNLQNILGKILRSVSDEIHRILS